MEEKMMKIADLIVRFRWPIIVFFIVVPLVFAFQIPRVEIEPDIKKSLPENMKSRLTLDRIEEIFGGTEMAMVILTADDVLEQDTLLRVKKISKKIKRLKGVDKVLSLFELKDIKGEQGAMIVEPAVKRIPRSRDQKEALRQRLKNNDMVYGAVVSRDFTATAVIAQLKSDVSDDFITNELKKIAAETPGKENILYGGMPFIRAAVSENTRSDLGKLLPLGILIMLVFLFVCFRQLRGVILPFIVVIMSILFAMGLIPLLGWKIHVVSILLPIILIAVANDYGIHLMSKYQEDNLEGNQLSTAQLAKNGFLALSRPVIATGITTIAGLLCLAAHIIIPAEQLGVLAGAGILFAVTASLLFIPAMLSLLPKAKPVINEDHTKAHLLEKMLHSLAGFVSSKPLVITIVSVLIVGFLSFGIKKVVVDTNPVNYFKQGHPVVKANNVLNQKLGGVNVLSVVAEGDIKNPQLMRKINALEQDLETLPDIGNTVSIARVMRQMSRALNDKNEPGYDTIPAARDAVAQYFELYLMSGDPEDFERQVDFPFQHAQVTARITSPSSVVIKEVVKAVEKKIENHPEFIMVGGFAAIFTEIVKEVVNGQFTSLLLSLVVVALLVVILFRSWMAGLFSIIPLGLSLLLLFGIMGFSGIELTIVTALLSSIMVGVGVDYTIHFLWRYRKERRKGLEPAPAVRETLITSGRGIIFNALSVIVGFVVLLISSFHPVNFFGLLVLISISTCLLGALVLLPSLCILLRPKFLEPESPRGEFNQLIKNVAVDRGAASQSGEPTKS
jgi:hydrophobe/amphiphile efflux-3 (HAE3) family protein